MVSFFSRKTPRQRVVMAVYVVAALMFVAGLIWHLGTWPSSLVLIVGLILNSVGGTPGMRNAQENDPNRR